MTSIVNAGGTPFDPPDSSNPYWQWRAGQLMQAAAATSPEELLALSASLSGHVREKALRRCRALGAPELLPVALSRLNDWVPAVRDVAREVAESLLPAQGAQGLLAALPALQHLRQAGRSDHTAWVAHIEARVVELAGAPALLAGAGTAGGGMVARACFDLAQRRGLLDAGALGAFLAGARNDIVLALRAASLCAAMPAAMHAALYRAAFASHFGAVRTLALRALLALTPPPPERSALVLAGLRDGQSSVRSVAMAHCAAAGIDARSCYRELVLAGTPAAAMRAGLAGLAALRDPRDTALFKTTAAHPLASVRQGALAAWIKVLAADKDAIAALALADPSPALRKFALVAVRMHGAWLPFEQVRERLEALGELVLLLRFSQQGRWNWIECIARSVLRRPWDQGLRALLSDTLGHWINSGADPYSAPEAAQRAFLAQPHVRASLAGLLQQRATSPFTQLQAKQRIADFDSLLDAVLQR